MTARLPGQGTLFISLAILLPVAISSCATLLNGPSHRVRISTNITSAQMTVNSEPCKLVDGYGLALVKRKIRPTVFTLEKNDSTWRFIVDSNTRFSKQNETVSSAPNNTIIERKIPKRFSGEYFIHFEKTGDSIRISRFAPMRKGAINAVLAIPYINHFSVRTAGTLHDRGGFFGLGAGLEYFTKENRYLTLQMGIAIDNEVPVPAAVEYGGDSVEYVRTYAAYANLRRHYATGSFDWGYGISLCRLHRSRILDQGAVHSRITESSLGLGLSMSVQYRITRGFRAGISYQPVLLALNDRGRLSYQHFISAEMIFPFNIYKGK